MKRKKKNEIIYTKIEDGESAPWFTNEIKDLSNDMWFADQLNKYKPSTFIQNFNNVKQSIKPKKIKKSNDLFNFISYKNPNKLNVKINSIPKEQQINILDTINEKYAKTIEKCKNSTMDDKKKQIRLKTLTTKKEKELKNVNKVLRCSSEIVNFNDKQKKIIFKWLNECDKVYNFCVKSFNEKNKNFNKDYKIFKLYVFEMLYGDNEKDAPYNTLTDEVRIFMSNLKSCETNMFRGNISNFEMKDRRKRNIRSILIRKQSITENGICPQLLGEQDNFNLDINKIVGDCRLIYNYKSKEFALSYPIYNDIKDIKRRKQIVALDPGEKIFMTFYSPSECGKIGEDMRNPILAVQQKIRKQQQSLDLNKNKNGKKIRNKRKLRQKINKNYKKIKNWTKELHNKTALFLCKNYKEILIPEFKTQNMIMNKEEKKNVPKTMKKVPEQEVKQLNKDEIKDIVKRNIQKIKENGIKENKSNKEIKNQINKYRKVKRLNARVKFVLNQLSHYKFRQHLLSKAEEYGCKVRIVTEEYTSKCCGKCGKLSNKYNNREKECPYCNTKINRDINGSRNILLKNNERIRRR